MVLESFSTSSIQISRKEVHSCHCSMERKVVDSSRYLKLTISLVVTMDLRTKCLPTFQVIVKKVDAKRYFSSMVVSKLTLKPVNNLPCNPVSLNMPPQTILSWYSLRLMIPSMLTVGTSQVGQVQTSKQVLAISHALSTV